MKKRDADTPRNTVRSKYSVFGYIAVLFVVTLLLMLLSWFISQRNDSSTLKYSNPNIYISSILEVYRAGH